MPALAAPLRTATTAEVRVRGDAPAGLALSCAADTPRALTRHAAQIRFTRMGRIKSPFYRLVVMDSRTRRDGRPLEVRASPF